MECEFCKKTFTNKATLTRHQKSKYCRAIQDKIEYKCIEGCNYTTKSKDELKEHQTTCFHYGQLEYEKLLCERYGVLIDELVPIYAQTVFDNEKYSFMDRQHMLLICLAGTVDKRARAIIEDLLYRNLRRLQTEE